MDGAGARAKTSALTTSALVASADAASLAKLHNSNNSEVTKSNRCDNVYCTYGHLNDIEEAYPSSNL